MELQWPLILFTSLIAWSAGVFGTQGILALQGRAYKAQLAVLISSLVIMVVGGIAVFMHLEHWERIFNGFGHITSGITQELIGIVLMVICMAAYFVYLRRNDDNTVPRAIGIFAIVVSFVTVIAMGHSYMLESRPVWDSFLEIASLFAAACAMGPATVALCLVFCGDDPICLKPFVLIGTIINALICFAYLVYMGSVQGEYADIGYYYDPTQIARGMLDFDNMTDLFGDNRVILIVLLALCLVCSIIAAAVLMKNPKKRMAKTDAEKTDAAEADTEETDTAAADSPKSDAQKLWKILCVAIIVFGLVSAIVLRVIFYELGATIYIFY